MLNAEPSNLVLLKIYKTEFDEIIITFTDQNGRPLAIEDKVKLHCLLTNRNDALFYTTSIVKIC